MKSTNLNKKKLKKNIPYFISTLFKEFFKFSIK